MEIEIKGIKYKLIRIPKGTFMMGSPKKFLDEVLHEVTLTEDFWMGETVCTQEFWKAVMGDNPSHFKGEKRPVEMVSWNDVNKFIKKLNKSFGHKFRLPTEAEWEYACRAGTTTPFSFGEKITTDQVNFDGNYLYAGAPNGKYRNRTVPVKSLPANPWGLYEMHGNVWEWCADWYGEYDLKNIVDPKGQPNGVQRVLRGGCYLRTGNYVRSACRNALYPDYRYVDIGFRLARDV